MSNQGCATTKTIEVVLCVGISESVSAGSIDIYPNPTTGKISFNNPEALGFEINILDFTGKNVLRSEMGTIEIDLSSLPAGVYQLLLSESGRVIRSEKIVKQ